MTPERWKQVKQIFDIAVNLPAAERADYIQKACGDDESLCAELLSLLAAHEQSGSFMDTGSLDPAKHSALHDAVTAGVLPELKNHLGERIGAYRIVGMLGAGGMGDVYKAIRDDDQYQAEVAVKLMRADVRNSVIAQRFRTERQILAGLDHHNIARLFDGGATESGVPYVVMELVAGEPIDSYCASHKLNMRDRVQLFLQVCAAVSYAHQRLIVHRDLKPSNVLVTADGTVKLLDFGIAKLLEPDAAASEMENRETVTSLRMMTLDYASPEQVSGGTITTASDVYSLGIMLFRLLTGKSPYGDRTTDSQRIAVILSDTAVERPSSVRADEPRIQRDLKGDLDNILMMALRKEPQHRYSSVEQFANDLRNFLSGLPVHARGNALRYRAGKFIRRHKIEIAAGILVIISLVTGIAISTHQARMAEQQRQIAQRHFDGVRHLANTLLFDFHDQIKDLQGATRARDLLVKTSLEYLNTLAKETGSDLGLQEELAIAFKKVGDIQGNVGGANTGDPKGAQQSYSRAIELLQPVVAVDTSRHRAIRFMATALTDRARLRLFSGEFKVALADAQQGVSLLESLRKAHDDIDVSIALVSAYKTITEILDYSDQRDTGETYANKAIALGEALKATHPTDTTVLRNLSGAYTVAGNLAYRADPSGAGFQKAMSRYRNGEKIDETIVSLNAGNARYQYFLATTRFTIANTLCEHRDYEEALRLIHLAQPAFAAAAADNSDAQARLANVMANFVLAKVLVGLTRDEEARLILIRNVAALKQVDPNSDPVRTSYFLAQFETILAALHSRRAADSSLTIPKQLENWRQAKAWYEDSIVRLKNLSDSGALDESDNQMMTDTMSGLAHAEAAIKKIVR